MNVRTLMCVCFLFMFQIASAQEQCQFYQQYPLSFSVTRGTVVERETEFVFTNRGTSTWQRTGGVSNLDYIELRPVDASGSVNVESPLYHSSWINRMRVGTYIEAQQGVSSLQNARFVFRVVIDASALAVGQYRYFFRPYHARWGYIPNWSSSAVVVNVTEPPHSSSTPPNASIVMVHPSTTVDTGTMVTLTGYGSNFPFEYEWKDGGTTIANSQVISRYFEAGTHELSFRARNSAGWSAPALQTITSLNPLPVPTILSVSQQSPVLAGTPITFVGQATNHPTVYRWMSLGQVLSNEASFTQSFEQGSYLITFAARNESGWSSNAAHTLYVVAGPQNSPSNGSSQPASGQTDAALQAQIVSMTFERTVLNTGAGDRAAIESYNLIDRGSIPFKSSRVVQLRGRAMNASAINYEWSVSQGSQRRVIGNQLSMTTRAGDLFIGEQTVHFRFQATDGRWSNDATFNITVLFWPRLTVPVQGDWKRAGYDYNEGDHLGARASGAEDWNQAEGDSQADFAREILATLPGFVQVGVDNAGGNYVTVNSPDYSSNVEFRTLYFHLSSILVRDGQRVIQGQPIGLAGSTGASSTATHLHYVLQKKINGDWVSQIPEPVWIDEQTLKQTIYYGERIQANVRQSNPDYIILSEPVISNAQEDAYGWGQHKYWCRTVSGAASVFMERRVVVPDSGQWQIFFHNPTGITSNSVGTQTHNSTQSAHFTVRIAGYADREFFIPQNQRFGQLVEIAQLDLEAGQEVFITQDNATGEDNKEMTIDEIVVLRYVPGGAGGTVPLGSPSDGISTSGDQSSWSSGDLGSSGGGGCTVNRTATPADGCVYFVFVLVFFLITVNRWRPKSSY